MIHGTLRKGTAINTNKLTEDDVRHIRRAVNESGVALAAKFGISPAMISNIRLRKAWAWLE